MKNKEYFRATPILNLDGKVSIAFVFTGTFHGFEDGEKSLNFEHFDSRLRETYVQPIDAFIGDICDKNAAGMHFPLIMQLYQEPDAVKNDVHIHLPGIFEYSAEGYDRVVKGIRKSAHCQFRESFVLFETGRFYYTICFYQDLADNLEEQERLTEYGVIQLLQLAEPTYLKIKSRENVSFEFRQGKKISLLEAANARLRHFTESHGNCVHDIAEWFGTRIASPSFSDWDSSLSHCMLQIDHPLLCKVSQSTSNKIDVKEWMLVDAPKSEPNQGDEPGHFDKDTPKIRCMRMSLAGLCQNVCDFPYQDDSEIEDSLRPVYFDPHMSFFFRHRIFVEISEKSRSLSVARALIGICPYLYCVCLLIRFDEQLLEQATKRIRKNAFAGKEQGHDKETVLVHPFGKLFDRLKSAGDLVRASHEREYMITSNLELLRDFHFRFLGNPFRYQTEREMFVRALDQRSIVRRYNEINALIERLSKRIDEIEGIGDSRALNWLNKNIFWLTSLTVVFPLIEFWWGPKESKPALIHYSVFALVLIWFFGFLLRPLWLPPVSKFMRRVFPGL